MFYGYFRTYSSMVGVILLSDLILNEVRVKVR